MSATPSPAAKIVEDEAMKAAKAVGGLATNDDGVERMMNRVGQHAVRQYAKKRRERARNKMRRASRARNK